jgi:hypothetical protein
MTYKINCPDCSKQLQECSNEQLVNCECGFSKSFNDITESFKNGEVTMISEGEDKPEKGSLSEHLESTLNEGLEKIHVSKTKNPDGHEIFYDSKEGKYYNKSTDVFLSTNDLKKFGLMEDKKEEKDLVDDESEGGEDETKPTGKLNTKQKGNKTVSEAINTLFEGQELSEDFKTKTATVFRAAVQEAVDVEKSKMQEAFEAEVSEVQADFDTKLAEAKDELTEQLDKYLDHVVECYLEDNKIAIQSSLKVEAAEQVLEGMKHLFEENHLEVPEGKDIVAELESKLDDAKSKLDESIKQNVDLNHAIKQRDRAEVLGKIAEGLADSQKDKLSRLAESVKFSDADSFAKELKVLRESFIDTKELSADLNENTVPVEDANINEDEIQEQSEEKPEKTYMFRL